MAGTWRIGSATQSAVGSPPLSFEERIKALRSPGYASGYNPFSSAGFGQSSSPRASPRGARSAVGSPLASTYPGTIPSTPVVPPTPASTPIATPDTITMLTKNEFRSRGFTQKNIYLPIFDKNLCLRTFGNDYSEKGAELFECNDDGVCEPLIYVDGERDNAYYLIKNAFWNSADLTIKIPLDAHFTFNVNINGTRIGGRLSYSDFGINSEAAAFKFIDEIKGGLPDPSSKYVKNFCLRLINKFPIDILSAMIREFIEETGEFPEISKFSFLRCDIPSEEDNNYKFVFSYNGHPIKQFERNITTIGFLGVPKDICIKNPGEESIYTISGECFTNMDKAKNVGIGLKSIAEGGDGAKWMKITPDQLNDIISRMIRRDIEALFNSPPRSGGRRRQARKTRKRTRRMRKHRRRLMTRK